MNDWTDSFDNKLGTDAIYLDFAKAFDTVPHNRLKLKLRNAGIRGNVLRARYNTISSNMSNNSILNKSFK
jgi:hypothetical protein